MIYNRHSLNKPQLRGCSNIDLVKPPLSGGFIFLLHFSIKSGKIYVTGVIAQLFRAPPLQGGGPGLESLLLHQIKNRGYSSALV